VPVRREPGVVVRVYSGTSGAFRSTTRNYVPVTLIEAALQPDAGFDQDLPLSYNGFLFVVDGEVRVGETLLKAGQVGWLDRGDDVRATSDHAGSLLQIAATTAGARAVLYAGQPQHDPIVSQGPFIADTRDDIVRLYNEYRGGQFERMSHLARAARTT